MTDTNVKTQAPVPSVIEVLQLEFPEKVGDKFRTVAFILGENNVVRLNATDTQYIVMCADATGIAFPVQAIRSASFKLITAEEASAKVTEMLTKAAAEAETVETAEEVDPNDGDKVVSLDKARKAKK